MSTPRKKGLVVSSASSTQLKAASNGSARSQPRTSKGRAKEQATLSNGKTEECKRAKTEEKPVDSNPVEQFRVGVLPLVDGILDTGDDGRAVVWLDIDNTLYSKGTEIHILMTERIRAYIKGLGLDEEEAERLHRKYYKEYGLAIRGLVMHHKIDALDYDSKCDATLPLETVLAPNEEHKTMLKSLDRSKCRVWALTNAYKTHAVRVLKLLELYDLIEGIIYCDYAQEGFACKPEREFYDAAMKIIGLKDTSRCYFVDDSILNITAARKLKWGNCVFFNEPVKEEDVIVRNRNGQTSNFDASVLLPQKVSSSLQTFDKARIQSEFRNLTQQQRTELLHIILEACSPGDVATINQTLEKQLRLTKDIFSSLCDNLILCIFEKLEVKELLNCQMVCKKWKKMAANHLLWKSHALGLTEGDPVTLTAPPDSSGWEHLVRGLYFRERNWAKGICQTLTLMQGHTGFVTAMKLKGRKTLVTGSYDETIRVWDLDTSVCKKVLTAKAIACLDFLDDEGILAAGLYDTGRVMVWDMKTWSLLQTLNGHNRGIRHIALSSDYLVSVGQDKSIVVWDWKQGSKLVRFGQQSNVSLGVSIVDRDKIVAVTVDGIIRTFSIRRKEMIGQFDLARLSSSLSSQFSGLKGGTLMMQWFAAHRNTLTLASQNIVVHLQWQEHVVPVLDINDDSDTTGTPPRSRPRSRSDSTNSNVSTASNMTSRSNGPRKFTTTPNRTAMSSLTPSHSSSSINTNRLMTPSRFNSTPIKSPIGGTSPSSAAPWPTSPAASARMNLTPSPLPSTPTKMSKGDTKLPSPSIPLSPTVSKNSLELTLAPAPATSTAPAQTRIAPNLSIAPIVVNVVQTPEAAVGCIDPAKKRIVLATRFSSRAGADRRIYTSTLDDNNTNYDKLSTSNRKVVAIGGAWQAKADELAIPSHNPMSLVLDHENCVVGTSEGLVYRMGFVGSEYKEEATIHTNNDDEINKTNYKEITQIDTDKDVTINNDGSTTITNLLQLQTVWKHLFV